MRDRRRSCSLGENWQYSRTNSSSERGLRSSVRVAIILCLLEVAFGGLRDDRERADWPRDARAEPPGGAVVVLASVL
jgi:hypothetical protein